MEIWNYFSSVIERASGHTVAKRGIKGQAIDHIFVALEGLELLTRVCVPDFAGSIVASCDKPK